MGDAIKDYFEEIKKTVSPDLVFTHYRDDRHQDHRVVSDLTWNTFRNHVILEYEIPKYDGDLGARTSSFLCKIGRAGRSRRSSQLPVAEGQAVVRRKRPSRRSPGSAGSRRLADTACGGVPRP